MLRLFGLLLFLPVPTVLFLFTRTPFGVPRSLALGVLLVLTHRLYARPFALRASEWRCLWCGGAVSGGVFVPLLEPGGPSSWRACLQDHAERVGRVMDFAGRHRILLRSGILGTLALYLAALLLPAHLVGKAVLPGDALAFFRLGIAFSVLPLALLGPSSKIEGKGPVSLPFPVHIQALIGTSAVLWLFRLVGAVWLAMGVVHVARRTGLVAL